MEGLLELLVLVFALLFWLQMLLLLLMLKAVLGMLPVELANEEDVLLLFLEVPDEINSLLGVCPALAELGSWLMFLPAENAEPILDGCRSSLAWFNKPCLVFTNLLV